MMENNRTRGRRGSAIRPFLFAVLLTVGAAANAAGMTVYKTATCGCCAKWVEHVRAAGFDVTVHDVSRAELIAQKQELGIDRRLSSCHTAVIDGYVVEGHIPASDIERLLEQQPDIAGIAVPGMPAGSPGMDFGNRTEPYNVIAFKRDGRMAVFAEHGR